MLQSTIEKRMNDKRAIILMGARQVGKTTLIRSVLDGRSDVLWLSGDEAYVQAIFEEASSPRLRANFGDNKIIVIDEAQRIKDIGLKLKLITDQLPEYKLITTGSSSFDLASQVTESLAGRKWEYHLHPLSFAELVGGRGLFEETQMLPHRLVFGSYPEVVENQGDERSILRELTGSILYKDVLAYEGIKSAEKIQRLLRALAYQVGSEVSFNELATTCEMSAKTAEKYVDVLEKAYIVFRLASYSTNLRTELKKSRKIYFSDLGVRNSVIADFRPLELRNDVGALWENWLISERRKMLEYRQDFKNTWFWRTTAQSEVDYIEDSDGVLTAYEFKWNPKAKSKGCRAFRNAYPDSTFEIIHKDNFSEFLL